MRESPFYEVVLERGEARGQTRAKREAILKLLEGRFGVIPQRLTTHIAETEHIPRLDAMFEAAIQAESLEELDWVSR